MNRKLSRLIVGVKGGVLDSHFFYFRVTVVSVVLLTTRLEVKWDTGWGSDSLGSRLWVFTREEVSFSSRKDVISKTCLKDHESLLCCTEILSNLKNNNVKS